VPGDGHINSLGPGVSHKEGSSHHRKPSSKEARPGRKQSYVTEAIRTLGCGWDMDTGMWLVHQHCFPRGRLEIGNGKGR
jgi:hypothetical protein